MSKKQIGEDIVKGMLDKIASSGKPKYSINECEMCGCEFTSVVDDAKLCLHCMVKRDMKLDDNSIINMNIINLWKNKRYDKKKGIDPILKMIAEGVVLLKDEVTNRTDNTGIKVMKASKGDKEIEKYIKFLRYRMNGKFDALVVLRFNPKEDFTVIAVRLSNKTYKHVSSKGELYMKNFLISLIVRYKLENSK